MLYGCETMPPLTSADNGLVRWIYGVRHEKRIRTQELHEKLSIINSFQLCQENTFEKSAIHQRWTSTINDGKIK